jgi:hypothetical protein
VYYFIIFCSIERIFVNPIEKRLDRRVLKRTERKMKATIFLLL